MCQVMKGKLLISKLFSSHLVRYFPQWVGSILINKNVFELITLRMLDELTHFKVLFSLKKSSFFRFLSCSDITAADMLNASFRFVVYFNIVSLVFNHRCVIKCYLKQPYVMNSVCKIFSSANWQERELFDMFGITFLNHPHMSRILTDYGFSGYPLRKDFPLSGLYHINFSPYLSRIQYSKLIFK